MKKFVIIFVFLFSIFSSDLFACDFEGISFQTGFSSARLTSCEQRSKNRFYLLVEAENYPVNQSPWYAFKVMSRKKRKILITMEFKAVKARYHPKISKDGISWNTIPFEIKNNKLSFSLNVEEKPLFVAGQEIVTNSDYAFWLNGLSKLTGLPVSKLGGSVENRTIYQMESKHLNNSEWIVLLGRQHPPEITGALAFFSFSQELLLDSGLANTFRKRFNILLVPNLNPDGVERGYWRHNINGVDLNRDWGVFKQKETLLVKSKLDEIVKNGGKIVFALDFHSTFKDTLYTIPADYGINPPQLVKKWTSRLMSKLVDFKFRIKPGYNSSKGVFKQFIADTYGVHAVTYEMGDNTDRKKIAETAKIAAQTFMQQMLETPAKDFDSKH